MTARAHRRLATHQHIVFRVDRARFLPAQLADLCVDVIERRDHPEHGSDDGRRRALRRHRLHVAVLGNKSHCIAARCAALQHVACSDVALCCKPSRPVLSKAATAVRGRALCTDMAALQQQAFANQWLLLTQFL
jgi:hypothetical protein